ncbi:hypothetical protein PISMIDRAFT_683208 [Pisolithus microcarpus 441]|uniref:Uncharacterized protein n=1 Tax=Pisolithus microcarpus 441 TaxID=765257 RepID=A0A0C9YS07_9AGAM|nr:hypothetical protein PISMIDRAFT_683208 [Pisolithus microcarpus 441]
MEGRIESHLERRERVIRKLKTTGVIVHSKWTCEGAFSDKDTASLRSILWATYRCLPESYSDMGPGVSIPLGEPSRSKSHRAARGVIIKG